MNSNVSGNAAAGSAVLLSSMIHDVGFAGVDAMELDGTLFDIRNKSNAVPLFYVDGPVNRVTNPQYKHLQNQMLALRAEAEEIRQQMAGTAFTSPIWDNMDQRFTEGTPWDKSNIVAWMRFRSDIMTNDTIKTAFRVYWSRRITDTVEAAYNGLPPAPDALKFEQWKINMTAAINDLFTTYRDPVTFDRTYNYTGLPPTLEFTRYLLQGYMTGAFPSPEVLTYLHNVRSPLMWVWGRKLANSNIVAQDSWDGQIKNWLAADNGTETVAELYDYLDRATGGFVKRYASATTDAEQAAVIAGIVLPPDRLLAGASVDQIIQVVNDDLNNILRDAVLDPNFGTIHAALKEVLKMFDVPLGAAPADVRNEITNILHVVSDYLMRLDVAVVQARSVMLAVINASVAVLQLSGVGADQMFAMSSQLLSDDVVLDKLVEMITLDFKINMDTALGSKRGWAVQHRDDLYEYFRTRSAWAMNAGVARSDPALQLLQLRRRSQELAEIIKNTDSTIPVPIVFEKLADNDPLRAHPQQFKATIVDERPKTGGPGGYEFDDERVYKISWKSSREVPRVEAMSNGEITEREGVQKTALVVVDLISNMEIRSKYTHIDIVSPMFNDTSNLANGTVWCEVSSESKNNRVAVVNSPSIHFESKEYCTRCGKYFSPLDERFGSCVWYDEGTHTDYVGRCNAGSKSPTFYDVATGVRGSMPTPQYTSYNMVTMYDEVERVAKSIRAQLGTEEAFQEALQQSKARVLGQGEKWVKSQIDKLVGMEQLMWHAIIYPLDRQTQQNAMEYSAKQLFDEWLDVFFSPKRLSIIRSV